MEPRKLSPEESAKRRDALKLALAMLEGWVPSDPSSAERERYDNMMEQLNVLLTEVA